MNQVTILGRLTRDPEISWYGRETEKELMIARYTLAVNRPHKKGEQGEADFIPCTAFNNSAKFAEGYMRKGGQFLVCGSIKTGRYTDKDGNTRKSWGVTVRTQEFAGGNPEKSGGLKKDEDPDAGFYPIDEGIEDDDLPF